MLSKNFRGRPIKTMESDGSFHITLCVPRRFFTIPASTKGLQACRQGDVTARQFFSYVYHNCQASSPLCCTREREKKESEKNNVGETRSGCFGRRRRPYATLSPFSTLETSHPRAEKRPHSRGMRKQNQYTAPPPSDGNVRANHPWMPSLDVVRLPFLPPPPRWKNACVAEGGNHRHMFVPCSFSREYYSQSR